MVRQGTDQRGPAKSAIIAGVHGKDGGDLVAAAGPQLEASLATHLKDNRLPGGVAGVVSGDELAWSAGAGFADLAARQATGPAALYAIASITKTFYRHGHHAAARRWPA
jgi:CubicO group peptidase (beta-lactamase class C family)